MLQTQLAADVARSPRLPSSVKSLRCADPFSLSLPYRHFTDCFQGARAAAGQSPTRMRRRVRSGRSGHSPNRSDCWLLRRLCLAARASPLLMALRERDLVTVKNIEAVYKSQVDPSESARVIKQTYCLLEMKAGGVVVIYAIGL